jgi:hypothetical protein
MADVVLAAGAAAIDRHGADVAGGFRFQSIQLGLGFRPLGVPDLVQAVRPTDLQPLLSLLHLPVLDGLGAQSTEGATGDHAPLLVDLHLPPHHQPLSAAHAPSAESGPLGSLIATGSCPSGIITKLPSR